MGSIAYPDAVIDRFRRYSGRAACSER